VRELLRERPLLVPGAAVPWPAPASVPAGSAPRPRSSLDADSHRSPGSRAAPDETRARPRPADRAEAAAAPPPSRRRPPADKVVHVHIGRLEVSAGPAAAPAAPPRAGGDRQERPAPMLTLERFLGRPR
jgi:hypothetical protein